MKEDAAATTIQKHYRGFKAREQTKALKEAKKENDAATKIQAHYRGYKVRQQMDEYKKGAKTSPKKVVKKGSKKKKSKKETTKKQPMDRIEPASKEHCYLVCKESGDLNSMHEHDAMKGA